MSRAARSPTVVVEDKQKLKVKVKNHYFIVIKRGVNK
jgi:hypothetical protein